jgi:hypothetical protein
VVEVFGDGLTAARYRRGCGEEADAGSFDSLARARRRLRTNDALSRAMLEAFRAAWNLPARTPAFRDD